MARNFWDPSEGRHGLFDVWSFRGLGGIVASLEEGRRQAADPDGVAGRDAGPGQVEP